MYSTRDIQARVNALCNIKGLDDDNGKKKNMLRIRREIAANLLFLAIEEGADPYTTLSLLEDESNLTSLDVFDENFRRPIRELISDKLNADPIFPKLFDRMIHMVDRSIGGGEVVLPFILAGCAYSSKTDIEHNRGTTEVKKTTKAAPASLKTLDADKTDQGIADRLNKKYFGGNRPGARQPKQFRAHVKSITTDPYETYLAYFTELYPDAEVTQLAKDVAENYTDCEAAITAIGHWAVKQYQKVDGWYNLLAIDPDTLYVVNIKNVDDIDGLGLKYSPQLKRGKCKQAIPDGYVDFKI